MFPTWWKPRKPQAARLRQLDLSSTHGLLTEMLDKAATRNEILSEPDGTLGAPLQAVLDFCNSDLGSLHLLVREAYKEKGVQVTGKKPDTWISARVPVHKAEAPVVAATEADEVTSNASEYQEEPSIVVSFAELLCRRLHVRARCPACLVCTVRRRHRRVAPHQRTALVDGHCRQPDGALARKEGGARVNDRMYFFFLSPCRCERDS
jgi:hypothetical protein